MHPTRRRFPARRSAATSSASPPTPLVRAAIPTLVALTLTAGACGSGTVDPLVSGDGVDLAADERADQSIEQAAPTVGATVAANPTTAPTSVVPSLPQPAADASGTGNASPAAGSDSPAPAGGATTAPTAPPSTAAATTPTTQAPPTTQATVAPVGNSFPDVAVTDVGTGQAASLASTLGGGNRPVLLWFWSPF